MYSTIIKRLESAAARASKPTPKLIAVSKTQPNVRVMNILEGGHRVFGENRVQEAVGKWPDFRQDFSNVELHLLGPLQTNKVNQALPHFQYLHSLDRLKLATKLASARDNGQVLPKCFVQINIGNEPQKAGVLPADLASLMADLNPLELPIVGLMCIPPAGEDPRRYFSDTRLMAYDLGLSELSMGMSVDFEIAVEEGATMVRVGSAIFGSRDYEA